MEKEDEDSNNKHRRRAFGEIIIRSIDKINLLVCTAHQLAREGVIDCSR